LKLFTDPKPYIQGIFENQNPSHIVILNHFLRNQTVAEFISLSGYKQVSLAYLPELYHTKMKEKRNKLIPKLNKKLIFFSNCLLD